MKKWMLMLPALLVATVFAVAVGTGGLAADAAPAGAATGLHLTQEACAPDGSVSALMVWGPSNAGSQSVDLALDPGFATYSRGGPYASTRTRCLLTA